MNEWKDHLLHSARTVIARAMETPSAYQISDSELEQARETIRRAAYNSADGLLLIDCGEFGNSRYFIVATASWVKLMPAELRL